MPAGSGSDPFAAFGVEQVAVLGAQADVDHMVLFLALVAVAADAA